MEGITMFINVSNGELFDKYSILLIKLERINDLDKLEYISSELYYMKSIIDDNFAYILDFEPYQRLFEINNSLWDIENGIRQKEEANQFDDEFIKLEHLELPAQPLMEEYARKIMQKQRADRERDDRHSERTSGYGKAGVHWTFVAVRAGNSGASVR